MITPNLNQGALAPVVDEVDIAAPPVVGALPRDLNGVLIRNGPNPLNGLSTATVKMYCGLGGSLSP